MENYIFQTEACTIVEHFNLEFCERENRITKIKCLDSNRNMYLLGPVAIEWFFFSVSNTTTGFCNCYTLHGSNFSVFYLFNEFRCLNGNNVVANRSHREALETCEPFLKHSARYRKIQYVAVDFCSVFCFFKRNKWANKIL